MKRFFTNSVLLVAMCVAFSSFMACNRATTVQEGNAEIAKETKNSNYPPAPSGIIQEEIKDLDGNVFKLEDKRGKVILVDLWATWCGPCVAAMPDLIELQEKYKDKDFEIIGLDTDDENADKIKTFAQTKKLNYQLGYADEKMAGEFFKITRLQAIPQSILINREGKMVGIFKGGGSQVMNTIKDTVEKTVND